MRRIVHKMSQRDQRVRLAATVGKLKLTNRLVVLADKAGHYVLDQFPQVVRRIGQREELRRVLVYGPRAFLHDHVVQIRGEHRKR